jgi:hypothetical protein
VVAALGQEALVVQVVAEALELLMQLAKMALQTLVAAVALQEQ